MEVRGRSGGRRRPEKVPYSGSTLHRERAREIAGDLMARASGKLEQLIYYEISVTFAKFPRQPHGL